VPVYAWFFGKAKVCGRAEVAGRVHSELPQIGGIPRKWGHLAVSAILPKLLFAEMLPLQRAKSDLPARQLAFGAHRTISVQAFWCRNLPTNGLGRQGTRPSASRVRPSAAKSKRFGHIEKQRSQVAP